MCHIGFMLHVTDLSSYWMENWKSLWPVGSYLNAISSGMVRKPRRMSYSYRPQMHICFVQRAVVGPSWSTSWCIVQPESRSTDKSGRKIVQWKSIELLWDTIRSEKMVNIEEDKCIALFKRKTSIKWWQTCTENHNRAISEFIWPRGNRGSISVRLFSQDSSTAHIPYPRKWALMQREWLQIFPVISLSAQKP